MPKKTPPAIELYRTDRYYIFQSGEFSIWWDRNTGECQAKSGWDLASAVNPECLGILYGIIGKVELLPALACRLMLIRQYEYVGDLPGGHAVFKIKAVSFLPLLGADASSQDLSLEPCVKHQNRRAGERSGPLSGMFELQKQPAFAKTWGSIKSATNTIKNTTQQAAALASAQVKSVNKKRDTKENERFERRILEELNKLVTEMDSFYFSLTGDLTNSLQRQWKQEQQQKQHHKQIDPGSEWIPPPLWKRVDDRFFWNMNMLRDIMQLESPQADPWLLPVIQGFVQVEACKVDVGSDRRREAMEPCYETFSLTLISRRSRFRAGTRYKRRGVDDSGKCANYVETEQIISYHQHQVSFVQVRGSVPVYWSQPGYKYRPPPRLDKDELETQTAFEKHFHEELSVYGPVCVVNLVDQSGKEKVIGDSYANHVFTFNCPDLTYVTFDFHEYCRGMHFENVSILVSALLEIVHELRFCWLDQKGLICMQNGVFRVNCMDCLDRTNVVQTALAKTVMEMVFTKLGLIAPEGVLPANIRNTFQLLWANNGDTISRQYAGTNALKGDYTRTGERKFTGLMKDGMNSANRYYLSRFKDLYRQATIDLMLGNAVAEELLSAERTGGAQDAEDLAATAEHVKLLLEDCKKLLVPHNDVVLGAWGLIDADPVTGDPSETEMDTILILTPTSYYVACYDEQTDRVTSYQSVLLEELTSIEFGADQSSSSIFKSAKLGSGCCIRLNYKHSGEPGYFHMFRSTNLRFFNNMAIVIRNEEEIVESMKAICEAFSVALEMQGLPVPVNQGGKLEKCKSKVLPSAASRRGFLDMSTLPQMTRNVSENQLLALKSVGTKAISNVTQQFNKLNKLSLRHSFNTKKGTDHETSQQSVKGSKPIFSIGDDCGPSKSSSTEDLVNQCHILRNTRNDLILASCGILAGQISSNIHHERSTQHSPYMNYHGGATRRHLLPPGGRGLTYSRSDLSLSESGCTLQPIPSPSLTPSPHRTLTPEITVDAAPNVSGAKGSEHLSLVDARQLSHSSGEVTAKKPDSVLLGGRRPGEGSRSTSECDLTINIPSSQSESALKSLRGGFTNVLTSPSSTRDMVLSPLSRLAKGVQNLGANLDPRKKGRMPSAEATEEYRKLQEKWKHCRTRLIAL